MEGETPLPRDILGFRNVLSVSWAGIMFESDAVSEQQATICHRDALLGKSRRTAAISLDCPYGSLCNLASGREQHVQVRHEDY